MDDARKSKMGSIGKMDGWRSTRESIVVLLDFDYWHQFILRPYRILFQLLVSSVLCFQIAQI